MLRSPLFLRCLRHLREKYARALRYVRCVALDGSEALEQVAGRLWPAEGKLLMERVAI